MSKVNHCLDNQLELHMPSRKKRYRTERLQIMVDEAELEAIDNWRFRMRMPTRTAAIRELLRLGLNAALQDAKSAHEPDLHSKSTDFAVIDERDGESANKPVAFPGPRKVP